MNKFVTFQNIINGINYNIFPETYSDIVKYKDTNVCDTLNKLLIDIENVYTKEDVNNNIKKECTNLYNKILGIAGADITIDKAYDTLKEVAIWINEHGEIASGFALDISNLKKSIEDPESGILKILNDIKKEQALNKENILNNSNEINNIKIITSDPNSGLIKQIQDNNISIKNIQSKIYNSELYIKNESGEIVKDKEGHAIINLL